MTSSTMLDSETAVASPRRGEPCEACGEGILVPSMAVRVPWVDGWVCSACRRRAIRNRAAGGTGCLPRMLRLSPLMALTFDGPAQLVDAAPGGLTLLAAGMIGAVVYPSARRVVRLLHGEDLQPA